MPRRIAILDNIGGAALGIIVSGLAMTLAAVVLVILLQALGHSFAVSGGGAGIVFISDQIRQSSLVPFFRRMAPFFVRLLAPWFPGGLPPILGAVQ